MAPFSLGFFLMLASMFQSPLAFASAMQGKRVTTPLVHAARGGDQRPIDDRDRRADDNEEHTKRLERRRPSPKKKPKPLWEKVASQSTKLSGKVLSATARASGKVAYGLMSPKYVEYPELVGLWRLDQWRDDEERSIQTNIELTRRHTVRFSGQREQQPCSFTPSHWPRSAKLEFQMGDDLFFTCSIQRKLADKTVLKLRGKIFEKRWGGRKVLVGTFVGRRRLNLLAENTDEEDEDEEEEDTDTESGEEEDNHAEDEYDVDEEEYDLDVREEDSD